MLSRTPRFGRARNMNRTAFGLAALVCLLAALFPAVAGAQATSPCSVTLTAQPRPQAAGRPLTLIATATGCRDAQYQFFWYMRPSGPHQQQLLQPFSDKSSATWTPEALAGKPYEASVTVRSADGEASARTNYTMAEPGLEWAPLLPLVAVISVGLAICAWQLSRRLRYPRQDSNLRPSV